MGFECASGSFWQLAVNSRSCVEPGSVPSLETMFIFVSIPFLCLTAEYCQKGIAQSVPYARAKGVLLMEPYSSCTQFHYFLDL